MSQVRWYYEHSIYEETSSLTLFFEGASANVVASTPCGDDEEGNDLTERFVKGEEVELPLDFVYCHCSESPTLDAARSPAKESGELRFDEGACKTVDEGSIQDHQDIPDECLDEGEDGFGEDDFYGTGLVRRMPPLGDKPGEVRFEVDQDTATGIVTQLLSRRSLTDFLTFQIFSQIAPESFSPASLRLIAPVAGQANENAQLRRFADRQKPPTSSKVSLIDEEFIELLRDPNARISYRQIFDRLACKPETLKRHLINAKLARKGQRLGGCTFSTAELASDLAPYLQRLPQQGLQVDRLLKLFVKAGHISTYRIG
jgi:hypothetical protein